MKTEYESPGNNFKELIPKLIQKSKGLSQEIKNRIKLNHIFSEFESKASNQFNFFIKESEKRYLGSKYGAKIEYLLKSSEKRSKKEAFKILNDNFYINPEITKERKKMQKKATNEFHQNITDILNRLKGIKNEPIKKGKISLNDICMNSMNSLSGEKMKKNKKEVDIIFNNDEKLITKTFDYYKEYLKKIKPTIKRAEPVPDEEDIEKNSNNRIKRNMHFSVPKIQLLNYTIAFSPPKTKKQEDDENRINIKKLISYSISGKNILPKNNRYYYPLLNKKNRDTFIMNSTNSIVTNKALNALYTIKRYETKNNEISEKLGIRKIPSLNIYENLIKNNYKKIKLERKQLYETIHNSQKYIGLNPKEKLNAKIEENLNHLMAFEKDFYKYNNTDSN